MSKLIEFEKEYPDAFLYLACQSGSWRSLMFVRGGNIISWHIKFKYILIHICDVAKCKLRLKKKKIDVISFGFGDGWKSLVEDIAEIISKDPQATFSQVKEKFGLLRVYLNNGNEELYDRIRKIEKKSEFICEDCGSEEKVETKGSWRKTLCENCRSQRYKI